MDRVKTKKEILAAKGAIISKYLFVPVALFSIGYWFVNKGPVANDVTFEQLKVVQPKQAAINENISIRAVVEAMDSYYVDTTEAGKVEQVFAEEGDFVKKGQKLIGLTNTALMLNVISREALVTEQLNNLRNTRILIDEGRLNIKREISELNYQKNDLQSNIKRLKALVPEGYVSDKDIEDLTNKLTYTEERIAISKEREKSINLLRDSQLEQLEANTKRLKSNLEVVKQSLQAMTIKAPQSGYLTNFKVMQGEFVNRGTRVGKIDDFSLVKLKSSIDEFYLSDIKVGNPATINIDGQQYKLKVSKVYPNVINGQFEADLKFAQELPENLLPGQSFVTNIVLGTSEPVMTIPNDKYLQDSFGKWVFVMDAEQDITKKNIVVGRKSSTLVEVVRGLSPHDNIITNHYEYLTEYQKGVN